MKLNLIVFFVFFRFSTPFEAVSIGLIFIATISALAGHCSNDHKTLVACGLYMLGGKYFYKIVDAE